MKPKNKWKLKGQEPVVLNCTPDLNEMKDKLLKKKFWSKNVCMKIKSNGKHYRKVFQLWFGK